MRYAYGITMTIDLTLDTYEHRLEEWSWDYGYGVRHPLTPAELDAAIDRLQCDEAKKQRLRQEHAGAYRILPAWTDGLRKLRRPFNREHVLDYWRVGKAMILEELPDFHERPEWAEYRTGRKYAGGAKPGVIQHAIFKDILTALRTIAGAGRRRPPIRKPKRAK